MAQLTFDHGSRRARQARFAAKLTSPVRMLLLVSILVFVGCGVLLLVSEIALGWLVASLAVVPLMLHRWHAKYLSQLPMSTDTTRMDAILAGDVLAHLPASPTPQSLARAAMSSHGGQFFAVRFGIAPSFLEHLLSDQAADLEAAWESVLRIQQAAGGGMVHGASVVAGLVASNDQAKSILPQLQLKVTDLEAGAKWFSRLQYLIEQQNKPRRTSGIARDWAFGYIPYLERLGLNISEQIAGGGLLRVELDAHQGALDQMISTFGSNGRQNIALVGPLGVGKSSVVRAFAERLIDGDSKVPSSLQYRQVIMLDAAALISSAPGRGELEDLVNRLLIEAFNAKNVILCLEDAQLFFEEGVGSVDLTNVLLPILEGGRLRMLLTMDEQRWVQITGRNPALAAALNRISVGEANEEESLRVMQDQVIGIEFDRSVTFMYQAIKESYRLGKRYIHELSMPGQAIRALEMAAGHASDGLVTAQSVSAALEQSMGVKVAASAQTDEREKLLNLEALIHERMINQTQAVSVVSDALRRARAGVRNEAKPIGTFLFLGPTGVGKTELAKSLAHTYFGGEDHLVRVDLNEYVRESDVARLIASAASEANSLTAQVMRQPFSVILLDEIEKAHPKVLTTLLQMLDEGVLRDINGKEVSFRDSIVIATTNAGADMIRQAITAGTEMKTLEDQLINELIKTGQFKPEFLNRFDETVVFRPLTKEELFQVIDLIMAGINKTLSPQQISVTLDDELKTELVRRGYDPQLGARPLRRVVQRTVESVIAKRMLSGQVQPGDTIAMTLADIPAEQ